MVCERPNIALYVPTMTAQEPLMTPNTPHVDIWRRGDCGMSLRNRLDICHHYEIRGEKFDDYVRDAKALGIKAHYYPADGTVKMIDEDGHKFFLCNGGDYKKILEDMQLQAVFEDILTNDAEPTMVPKKNFRGNRGPSLLFTGSLSTKRGSTAQFAKPLLRAGSRRYWPLYVKVTKAIRTMASHRISANSRCFPEPFPVQADMTDRTREWGGSVAEGNCIESCSFLMYTSEFSFSKDSIDRLVSHVDKGNGRKEGWDWLATFWEQYYDSTLHRWVLIVLSATTRTSIEEYYTRKGCIGRATDLLIQKYQEHPESQRVVIPATLCPADIKGDHRVVPIHFDTLVFLSPLLWHVHRMRRFWASRNQEMSLFLATEMLVGFFKTNNPLRFHRFAQKVYERLQTTGGLGIPRDSTFLQELERFLFVTYGGWNGTTDTQGRTEGSMRTQPCTSNPQTDWSQESALISWLRITADVGDQFRSKDPTEQDHTRLIGEIKTNMIGLGDLFAQKVIFADAALGMTLPLSCFRNCLPGSGQHMRVLRQRPYLFERPDQVRQLVTSISVKAGLVREVAEELVCLTLKSDKSLGMYQEVNIKFCDLFEATLDHEQRICIRLLDYHSKRKMPARQGGFTMSETCHYYPRWAKHRDVSKYSANYARMASKSNFKFSIGEKTTSTQIRAMEKESVHFDSASVDFSTAQILLNSNKYLHVSDPVGELAKYLRWSKSEMIELITIRSKGKGYIATLDDSAFTNVRLDVEFKQLSDVGVNRRPVIDILNATTDDWSYRSRNGAILALFMHSIMNLHLRMCEHWSIDYLLNTKELLILLPVTREQDTAAVVGAMYRSDDDDRIRIRQITSRCEVLPPMVVAYDYNNRFRKRREGV
jgi:hypothetical protein